MSASTILAAPLAGWCVPLSEVPDPVFAERMAGDGVAIDPTAGVLHAPCDGEIVAMKDAKHAVTVRSASGVDVLMHVGIDTVELKGAGFEMLVAAGQRVRSGQPLLRFDLDLLARRARSLLTPIVLASPGAVVRRSENRAVAVGDFLMEIAAAEGPPATTETQVVASRAFRVPFEHGLHVRPAAQIAAALRPFASVVEIAALGRKANARSPVAMMSLGVHSGDTIEVSARGADALAAIAALEPLLAPVKAPVSSAARGEAKREAPATTRGELRQRIEASIASRGLAIGPAVRWTQPEIAVAERGSDESGEAAALARALATVQSHLEAQAGAARGEQRALLEAHVQLIRDPDLAERSRDGMRRGKSAAFAWRQATRAIIEGLAAVGDDRMRERAADLRDLENQVVRALSGEPPGGTRELPEGAILLADEVLPSQMIAIERSRVAGICSARGGPTSHMAILAAASGIPALVAAGSAILAIADGTMLALDAEHGWLDVDPPAPQRAALQRAVAQRAAERASDIEAARRPSRTRDGVTIGVNANLGSLAEARTALECGAEGCGLLRTEFLFLDRSEPPDEDEQARDYQAIATALDGRPVSIRTMDIGGDKPIAYLPMPHEDNPALGMRGVRASLAQPELLRTQLRAVLRVEPAGQCRVLLPMVTDLADFRAVRAILGECVAERGLAAAPALGVMIETPASALLAEQLAAEADFLSIGTNDLSQYALAVDRGHPQLAPRLDALHPAVLRLIALVADAGRAKHKTVSVCGALGSDVDALPILVGLGIHEISATCAMIPRLKRMARLLDAGECRELARRALDQASAAAVRELAAVARARARAPSTDSVSGG